MQQRIIDRWVEAAEARRVGEWAMAEQPLPLPTATPQPLMAKLRAMVMLVGHPRLGFGAEPHPVN